MTEIPVRACGGSALIAGNVVGRAQIGRLVADEADRASAGERAGHESGQVAGLRLVEDQAVDVAGRRRRDRDVHLDELGAGVGDGRGLDGGIGLRTDRDHEGEVAGRGRGDGRGEFGVRGRLD